MADRSSTGQLEPGTRLLCAQCGTAFSARNKNGVVKRFCSDACRTRFKNQSRLTAAAALKARAQRKVRRVDPRKQRVDLAVIPPLERVGLLRAAAQRLGLSETRALRAARAAGLAEVAE